VRSRALALAGGLSLLIALVAGMATAQPSRTVRHAVAGRASAAQAAQTTLACAGGSGPIQHVIYVQFDNTHFTQDRPNVASDLQQMPHLLNFLTSNGTLNTNDHTILISHTAGGILSSLTGMYPDRNGQTVSNSYFYYPPTGIPAFSTSFKYWTDLVDDATGSRDPLPNMVTDGQKNTPAPWVPFTRAGCDVGGVGTANIELENTGTGQFGDMTQVFGAGSPEWQEAQTANAQPPGPARTIAQTDFVGIAIHCSVGGGICADPANAPNVRPDSLPNEPGGYTGFQGLFGAKYVNPAIAGGSACASDTAGQPIADPAGQCGFPGFDGMLAKNTLGYIADMQEAGVPVTYGYISDAHDVHVPNPTLDTYQSHANGPGESEPTPPGGYVGQLKAYDDAFAAFFQNLAAHGINKSNTLFVFTVDEGDHVAAGTGTPQPDGTLAYAHTNCTVMTACPANQLGEVNADLKLLLPAGEPAFTVHNDDAPTVYVNGQPARTDPGVRQLERDMGNLNVPDPYVNNGQSVPLTGALADTVEEQTLHMVNTDPRRTPTFTLFANPDFFLTANGTTPSCGANPCVSPGFAYNHGDIQPEIATTWVGMVGPGVAKRGIDSGTWTDHTNLRPTILTLLGLHDDYTQDGRVLIEDLTTQATPPALRAHRQTVRQLSSVYEQLNAPFGQFGMDTLVASTRAIKSTDDAVYNGIEDQIASLTTQRDALALQIRDALNAATFDGQPLNQQQAKGWIAQAQSLIAQAHSLSQG